MKCKVLSFAIVYRREYYTAGTVFEAEDNDVEALVSGKFVEIVENPKPVKAIETDKPVETQVETPKAEEKPAEKPKPRGGKKK